MNPYESPAAEQSEQQVGRRRLALPRWLQGAIMGCLFWSICALGFHFGKEMHSPGLASFGPGLTLFCLLLAYPTAVPVIVLWGHDPRYPILGSLALHSALGLLLYAALGARLRTLRKKVVQGERDAANLNELR